MSSSWLRFPGAPRKGPRDSVSGGPVSRMLRVRSQRAHIRPPGGRTCPPPSPRSWLWNLSVGGKLLASGSHKEAPGGRKARRHQCSHLSQYTLSDRQCTWPPSHPASAAPTRHPQQGASLPPWDAETEAQREIKGLSAQKWHRSRLRTPRPSEARGRSSSSTQRQAKVNVLPARKQPKCPSTDE